jgi:hypothetical protein
VIAYSSAWLAYSLKSIGMRKRCEAMAMSFLREVYPHLL